MWHIEHPEKVFDYLGEREPNLSFQLIAIMKQKKYQLFPQEDRNHVENHHLLQVQDIKIKYPDNPAQLLNGKIVKLNIS